MTVAFGQVIPPRFTGAAIGFDPPFSADPAVIVTDPAFTSTFTSGINLNNLGSGDTTALIQAALNAAAAQSADQLTLCTVTLGPYTYNASGLTLPEGVRLTSNGAKIRANAAGYILTCSAANAAVDNIFFSGNGAGQGAAGINIASGASRTTLDRLRFDQFDLQAIKSDTGTNCAVITRCFAQNCLLSAATLGSQTGVIHLDGTDHGISNVELTASRSSVSASGFAAALYVGGANSMIENVQAEISDCGVYIASSSLKMVNVRADLNRGHGFVIASGDGQLTNCHALSNGKDTTNTYDGFNITAGNFTLVNCRAAAVGNTHRYGFNDTQNSGTNYNTFIGCRSFGTIGTASVNVAAFAGGSAVALTGPPLAITAAVTSWDVQVTRGWPYSDWSLSSVGAVNFTDFSNEVPGMRLYVRGDGNTTFVQNTSFIRLLTGANTLAATNTYYTFISHNGVWYQI